MKAKKTYKDYINEVYDEIKKDYPYISKSVISSIMAQNLRNIVSIIYNRKPFRLFYNIFVPKTTVKQRKRIDELQKFNKNEND